MKKIAIFYEFTRNGEKRTAEVATDAVSEAVARADFERKFGGKISRVIGTREIKR